MSDKEVLREQLMAQFGAGKLGQQVAAERLGIQRQHECALDIAVDALAKSPA